MILNRQDGEPSWEILPYAWHDLNAEFERLGTVLDVECSCLDDTWGENIDDA